MNTTTNSTQNICCHVNVAYTLTFRQYDKQYICEIGGPSIER